MHCYFSQEYSVKFTSLSMWSQPALHIMPKTTKGSGSHRLLTPVFPARAAPLLASVQTYSCLIIRTRCAKPNFGRTYSEQYTKQCTCLAFWKALNANLKKLNSCISTALNVHSSVCHTLRRSDCIRM